MSKDCLYQFGWSIAVMIGMTMEVSGTDLMLVSMLVLVKVAALGNQS
jgi:hypothetical protein